MPPKSPQTEYSVNESTIIRIPVGMAWAMAVGLVAGAFFAAMVWIRVGAFSAVITHVEDHEKRMIRIETKLGISNQNRDTNSAMVSSMRDDL